MNIINFVDRPVAERSWQMKINYISLTPFNLKIVIDLTNKIFCHWFSIAINLLGIQQKCTDNAIKMTTRVIIYLTVG